MTKGVSGEREPGNEDDLKFTYSHLYTYQPMRARVVAQLFYYKLRYNLLYSESERIILKCFIFLETVVSNSNIVDSVSKSYLLSNI